jgi:F-type H+-transporting ATPase subunit a
VVTILTILCLIYYFKQKKLKENEIPHGYVLIVEIIVSFIRNMVHEILGPKLDKSTPFFVFVFLYICLSNLIGILGFDNPTGSYTVTLSMALISYFSI